MNKEKHIGIISFHRALNYGAVLQLYALQNTLDKLKVKNSVLDYRNKKMERVFKLQKNLLKAVIKYIVSAPEMYEKKLIFQRFIKNHIRLTKKLDRRNILNNPEIRSFTGFITGSDQVFAYIFTDFDKAYFLDFAKEHQKKYSYAASFGSCGIPQKYKQEYQRLLGRFQELSVRERQGADLIKQLTSREAKVHLDPTLLLDKSDWLKLKKSCIHKKYILIYVMQEPIKLLEYASHLSELHNLELIYLGDPKYVRNRKINRLSVITPQEFLGFIEEASYILTNSFHGTVFSIIFQKKFMIELDSKMEQNTRVDHLFQVLGISYRYISNNYDAIEKSMDWNMINERLSALRKESIDYLRKITG